MSVQVINKHGTKVWVASERVEELLRKGFKLAEGQDAPETESLLDVPQEERAELIEERRGGIDLASHPPETVYQDPVAHTDIEGGTNDMGQEGVYLPESEAHFVKEDVADRVIEGADREAIKARLTELGVEFNPRSHTETLSEMLTDANNAANGKSR